MEKAFNDIFRLGGKEIWVIGGAGYLGQPIVSLLDSLGATVLCVDMETRAQNFVSTERLSSNVTAASLDIRQGNAAKSFVTENIKSRGVPHGSLILRSLLRPRNLKNSRSPISTR